MSAKKVPGGRSPIAKRCAFVGHLTNAENTAAVIGLLASTTVNYAGVSADCHHVGSQRFGGGVVSTVVQTVGPHLGREMRDGPTQGADECPVYVDSRH